MMRNCSRITFIKENYEDSHTVTPTFTVPGSYASHERHKAMIGVGAVYSLSCLLSPQQSQQELMTL